VCGFDFHLASFTQRIVNADSPLVREHLKPEFIAQIHDMVADGRLLTQVRADADLVLSMKRRLWNAMPAARHDAVGFQTICRRAGFRWVKVAFIRFLAVRGGPAPRCQDLPDGTYVVGEVPAGRRPYVLSYSWSASSHFAPGGGKMRELSGTLDLLGADDEDLCFVDYLSLWQGGARVPQVYASINGVGVRPVYGMVDLPDRTDDQKAEFRFALFETTRLYAFAGGDLPCGARVPGCRVVVLPIREEPGSFPAHGRLDEVLNEDCDPPAVQLRSSWGFQRSEPYERGGWTCAEYAVARHCGTIANPQSPAVKRVEASRRWPETVREYAEMMDEHAPQPIGFPKRGDRDAVRFNFYKYSHHISDPI